MLRFPKTDILQLLRIITYNKHTQLYLVFIEKTKAWFTAWLSIETLWFDNCINFNVWVWSLGRWWLGYCWKRIVAFWYNLINKEYKLSSSLYRFIFNHAHVHNFEYKWLANVKSILETTGLNTMWLNQATTQSRNVFVNKIEAILKDQYMQSWHNDVSTSDKCLNYRLYKEYHGYEQYLDILSGYSCIQDFIFFVFAILIYQLKIPRHERVCKLCNANQLGYEFHYLFSCPFFQDTRRKYILFY